MWAGRDAGSAAYETATCTRSRGQAMGQTGEDPRMEHVIDIRARVERSEYEVDASKVADAIIERLLQSRTLLDLDPDA